MTTGVENGVGTVLISGSTGNLGTKLIAHLLGTDWCIGIVPLVQPGTELSQGSDARVRPVECELTAACGPELDEAMKGVDAVVHLAAQCPYPDATWTDAAASFDMTLKLLLAAKAAGVKRFVFASSNHVMGKYKDQPEALIEGSLTNETPPFTGTVVVDPDGKVTDATAYAAAKLMGERACQQFAEAPGSLLTTVSLRIGWCQPGENDPQSISSSGIPGEESATHDPQVEHDIKWFRNMWLSNRDFVQAVERALRADAADWPGRAVIVNAMSQNTGMPWNLAATETLIGYRPQDNSWASD